MTYANVGGFQTGSLEKILHEIENERSEITDYSDSKSKMLARHWNNCIDVVEQIIKKHLSFENRVEITRSSRDNDGWIDCSEHLPEKGEKVLCYFKYEPESPDVMCDNVYIGSGMWQSETDKVVAWMKRPVDYKPPTE